MTSRPRLVLDTNTLVSGLLLPDSTPARATDKASLDGQILVSNATLTELADVLSRSKFDRYVSLEGRQEFLRSFMRIALTVEIVRAVHACRDPRDNKFLEVAVNGDANYIVTGDADLLALHPYQTIHILSPLQYLGNS